MSDQEIKSWLAPNIDIKNSQIHHIKSQKPKLDLNRSNNFNQEVDTQGVKLALDKGYQEGYQQGLSKAKAEQSALLDNLGALISDISQQRINLEAEILSQCVELSKKMAKTIVESETKLNIETMTKRLHGYINDLPDNKVPTNLKVHPDFVESITQWLNENLGDSKCIQVTASESVGIGGCELSNMYTCIDASLDTLLNDVRDELVSGVKTNANS